MINREKYIEDIESLSKEIIQIMRDCYTGFDFFCRWGSTKIPSKIGDQAQAVSEDFPEIDDDVKNEAFWNVTNYGWEAFHSYLEGGDFSVEYRDGRNSVYFVITKPDNLHWAANLDDLVSYHDDALPILDDIQSAADFFLTFKEDFYNDLYSDLTENEIWEYEEGMKKELDTLIEDMKDDLGVWKKFQKDLHEVDEYEMSCYENIVIWFRDDLEVLRENLEL